MAIVSEYTLAKVAGHVPDTDKEAIFERWAAHFNSMPNRLSNINENGIDRLPQIECNVLLDGNKKRRSITVIRQSSRCRCNA